MSSRLSGFLDLIRGKDPHHNGHGHDDHAPEIRITFAPMPLVEDLLFFGLVYWQVWRVSESMTVANIVTGIVFMAMIPFLFRSPKGRLDAEVYNHALWRSSRVITYGFNLRSILESLDEEVTDLHEPTDELFNISFSTKGPERKVRLTLSVMPDATGTSRERSRKILTWRSHEKGAVMKNTKATVRGILAPVFEQLDTAVDDTEEGKKVDQSLVNEIVIDAIDHSPTGVEAINTLKYKNGARFMWQMEDINRSEVEQNEQDELASFRRIKAAKDILEDAGYTPEEAKETIAQRTQPNTSKVIWKIEAPPTLTSFGVTGMPQAQQNKPSTEKKPRNKGDRK